MKRNISVRQVQRAAAAVLLAMAALYGLLTLLRPLMLELDSVLTLMRAGTRCLAMICIALLLLKPDMKPEKVFLLLGSLFGLCYVFMIVPLGAPDEANHLNRVLTVLGQWMGGTVNSHYMDAAGLTPHENSPEALMTFLQGLREEQPLGEAISLSNFVAFPLIYLPQLLAYGISMALGLNRFGAYILADCLSLGCYLLLMYQAIRILPRCKVPCMLWALVPIALQQAAAVSYDGATNGLAFLLIALVLRAVEKKGPASWQELTGIALVYVVLTPAKAVYVLLAALLILIPRERFGTGKKKWGYVALVCALCCIVTFVSQLGWAKEMLTKAATGENNYYTYGWVLTHPLQTLRLVLKSLFPFGIFFYLETAIGSSLSGLSLPVHSGFVYTILFLILLSCLPAFKKDGPLAWPPRLMYWAVAALVALACIGTMLVAWTPSGDDLIQGVQGRYLLPVIPLMMVGLTNSQLTCKKDPTLVCEIGMVLMELLVLNDVINHFAGLTF